MFEESDFEYFLEGELWVRGVNRLSNKFFDLSPMPILHAIPPQGYH